MENSCFFAGCVERFARDVIFHGWAMSPLLMRERYTGGECQVHAKHVCFSPIDARFLLFGHSWWLQLRANCTFPSSFVSLFSLFSRVIRIDDLSNENFFLWHFFYGRYIYIYIYTWLWLVNKNINHLRWQLIADHNEWPNRIIRRFPFELVGMTE